MSPLVDYFWPVLIFGVAVGAIAGTIQWRRKVVGAWRMVALAGAALVAMIGVLAWSGPLGGAERYIAAIERPIRQMLVNYEMTQVHAELRRSPLRRQIVYSGPADDFQRSELVKMAEAYPGVGSATWNLKVRAVPIVAEGAGVALLGLLLGLILAYLVELRRRNNSEWSW